MNFQTKSKQVYLVLFIGYVRDIPRFLQLNEFFFSIEHNMLIFTSLTSFTKQLSLATVVNYNTIKTRWFSFNRNWILSRTAIKPWHVYPNLNTMYVIKAYTFIVVYTNLITKIKYQRKTICWAWLFIMYKFRKDRISLGNSCGWIFFHLSCFLFHLISRLYIRTKPNPYQVITI